MDYFTEEEKSKMTQEFHNFDRKMIHEKYLNTVKLAETNRGLHSKDEENWIKYV